MNIHYRLLKLMHGSSMANYDFSLWMCDLPVIYGVWHPFKYCVLAVYRCFFPIFALLETTSADIGRAISGVRRVLHIEKMVLALLLLRHKIVDRARNALQGLNDTETKRQKGFSKISHTVNRHLPRF